MDEKDDIAAAIAASLTSFEEESMSRATAQPVEEKVASGLVDLYSSSEEEAILCDSHSVALSPCQPADIQRTNLSIGKQNGGATEDACVGSRGILLTPTGMATTSIAPCGVMSQEQIDISKSPEATSNKKSHDRKDTEYILCAVVWHRGMNANVGHYLADVRQPTVQGGAPQWKRFDDALVQAVGQFAPEVGGNGYMYYYMHRSLVDDEK